MANTPNTAIAYFTAKWCQPCKQVKPKMRDIADRYELSMMEIDIDETPEIAEEYGVMRVPSVVVLSRTHQPVVFNGVDRQALKRIEDVIILEGVSA